MSQTTQLTSPASVPQAVISAEASAIALQAAVAHAEGLGIAINVAICDSGGTLAGLALGCRLAGLRSQVVGVLVTDIQVEAGEATVAELRDDKDLRAELQKAVDDANAAVSHAESIKKFVILDRDLTEEDGEMTATLKIKRNVVVDRFSKEIEGMYAKS